MTCAWPACRIDVPHPAAIAERNEPAWVGDVIRFWFEELGDTHWFAKSEKIDAQICDRFLQLHQRLVVHDGLGVSAPRPTLAAIIVLDQFSRNLFRADARAFSADHIARRLSRTGIARRCDAEIKNSEEKYFFYLPFEHSEDLEDQVLAYTMIGQLGNEKWMRSAAAHMRIIKRFGRFPHRNKALKRPSTAEELAFLMEPVNSF
jgi:uncharacterized protein (DUF924 family)